MPTIVKKPTKQKIEYKQLPNTNKYYSSKYWKHLRQSFITQHPLCYDCLLKGISRPAEHIHHVIPFERGITDEEKWDLLLDPNNLVSLCQECHTQRHIELGSFKRKT